MQCANPELHDFSVCLPYALPRDPQAALGYLAFDAMRLERSLHMDRDELEPLVLAEDFDTMLALLIGTVLYRHLHGLEQVQVRSMAEHLSDPRLSWKFRALHGEMVFNPGWHPFSYSDQELASIIAMNETLISVVGTGLGSLSARDAVRGVLARSFTPGLALSIFTLALITTWQMENANLSAEQQRRAESFRQQLILERNS